MRIKFSGTPDKERVTYSKCREAIKFYSKLLMTSRLSKGLEINVKFTDLKKTKKRGQPPAIGECYTYEFERPKVFDIDIEQRMGLTRVLETLAHEMVHVEQDATGRCKPYVNGGMIRYEKNTIREKDFDYYDYPWEVEAYGREVGLYRRFRLFKKGKYQPKRIKRV
jgi:hypothetical protein